MATFHPARHGFMDKNGGQAWILLFRIKSHSSTFHLIYDLIQNA